MQPPDAAQVALPRYLKTAKAHVFAAAFSAGPPLQIEVGRTRCYPGLPNRAPDTRVLYDMAREALTPSRRVLDFGCGSGLGTAVLAAHFDHVSALDRDQSAVQFARAYLPGIDVACVDASAPGPLAETYDAICIVDVLGQNQSPERVLRAARRMLSKTGRIFIAEARANPAQTLSSPTLTAFSPRALQSLFVRAGLEAEVWPEAGSFVVCVARLAASEAWLELERGDLAQAAARPADALAAYARLTASPDREVCEEALLGSAAVYRAESDLNAACRCFLDVLALAPKSVRARAGLAEISMAMGEQAQALELAASALEVDPCDSGAARALALAAEGLRKTDANATWRIANGLAPADFSIAVELARSSAELGDLPFAIWVLERLRDFRDDLGVDFHVTLAWLYASAGRPGEAALEAQLARAKSPEHAAVTELCAHLDAETSSS